MVSLMNGWVEWVGRVQRSFVGNSGLCQGSRCVRRTAYVVRSVRGRGRPRHLVLLLEEILEGGARVHWLGGSWRGGFLFYANSHGKECAFIALVLARDSLGDGLGAF